MRFCKDCQWFEAVPVNKGGEPQCGLPRTRSVDRVFGMPVRPTAYHNRQFGPCGQEGKYWEEKPFVPHEDSVIAPVVSSFTPEGEE